MDTKKYFNNMRVLFDDYRHNIAEWEKAADKYCEEHGELATEEWAKENMMPKSPFNPGALNAMRLWEYKEKHGEDEISDAVIIYTSEIREFVSALREAGVESFLLTRSNSMLIERIHEYAKYGCSVDGPAIAVRYHGQTRIEERALRIRIN